MVIHCPKKMRTQYATGRSSHGIAILAIMPTRWFRQILLEKNTCGCLISQVVVSNIFHLTPKLGEDGTRFDSHFSMGWLVEMVRSYDLEPSLLFLHVHEQV